MRASLVTVSEGDWGVQPREGVLVKGIAVGDNSCLPALGVGRGWNGSLTGQQVIGGVLATWARAEECKCPLSSERGRIAEVCFMSVLN